MLSYIKFQNDVRVLKKEKKSDWTYSLALIEVDNMFAIAQISDESFLIVHSHKVPLSILFYLFLWRFMLKIKKKNLNMTIKKH